MFCFGADYLLRMTTTPFNKFPMVFRVAFVALGAAMAAASGLLVSSCVIEDPSMLPFIIVFASIPFSLGGIALFMGATGQD